MSGILRNIMMAAAVAALLATPAMADEVKVGVMASFSGPYAAYGKMAQEGMELKLTEHGGKVGDNIVKLEFRDVGGNVPARARQLAQEFVVRDKVQYLAGPDFTPTVLAVKDVINQANVPLVIINSGSSSVTRESPFYVRAGFTQWTVSLPLAQYAASIGKKNAVILVADFAPGHDAAAAFAAGFTEGGGKVIETVKVPLDTVDFSSYLQRIEELKPDSLFIFVPTGPGSVAFVKAYLDRGLREKGIDVYGTSEFLETELQSFGDSAIGIVNAFHESPDLDNPKNKAFVAAYKAKYGHLPDHFSVAGYDSMELILKMIEATNGKRDGQKAIEAVKGYKWDSPRGPVSIDPATREIVQNIYIRKVVKDGGLYWSRAFKTYEAVKEPWLERNPK